MEYFLIGQSEKIINPIKVGGPNLEGYTQEMTHRQFAKLKKSTVGYVHYESIQEIPDILSQPTYMVSESIKKVLSMYDDNISFKAIQVFPDLQTDIEKVARPYWIYDCVMEECLHSDCVKLPNGEYQKIIIDRRKIKGRDIFRPMGLLQNRLVVSLSVAESILRRNPYGVSFEKVEMR